MDTKPSKSDIEAVFHRLRAVSTNKTCFDCNAKNPTWSSVTYGVFICIDCSAVHRNLGVHLTFVRSTQLDTNWTWIQLRQMQLGGNANAQHFFSQHNCQTNDAQKKYNSRAAQLYRDKLQQLAMNALKNSTELHINSYVEEKDDEDKEVDFFSDAENFTCPDVPTITQLEKPAPKIEVIDQKAQLEDGPKVDFSINNANSEERKSTISVRKIQPKKSSLGAKKSGLGATKVKTNFAELEREAELVEESRLRAQEENAKAAQLTEQEKVEKDAAMRLAYKDISVQQQKKEEQMKKVDPKKAEQLERLGMGVNTNTKSGISHSMMNDMTMIEQENLQTSPSTLSTLGKLRFSDTDNYLDGYSFSTFSMNRNANSNYWSKDSSYERIVDDPPNKNESTNADTGVERTPITSTRKYEPSTNTSSSNLAQQKFGNAKSISSAMFNEDSPKDFETQMNLNRFQGSSSISSSDFFGSGQSANNHHSSFEAPDLDDVRESVRQGVTKVAGKLSSLANGVMSSLQDKYGY